MHSPVLINYDPGWIDDYSAWEYETDDYYDGEGGDELQAQLHASASGVAGKRKRRDSTSRKRKRRKQGMVEENIPALDLEGTSEMIINKLTRPLVVWRKEDEAKALDVPVVEDGEGIKVALLKDWKERLNADGGAIVNGVKGKIRGRANSAKKSAKGTPLSRNATKENCRTAMPLPRKRRKEEDTEELHGSSASDDEGLTDQRTANLRTSRSTKVQENRLEEQEQSKLQEKAQNEAATAKTRKTKRQKVR